jgi:hypothetical protein
LWRAISIFHAMSVCRFRQYLCRISCNRWRCARTHENRYSCRGAAKSFRARGRADGESGPCRSGQWRGDCIQRRAKHSRNGRARALRCLGDLAVRAGRRQASTGVIARLLWRNPPAARQDACRAERALDVQTTFGRGTHSVACGVLQMLPTGSCGPAASFLTS